MGNFSKELTELEKLQNKYEPWTRQYTIKDFIAKCVSRDSELDTIWLDDCLVTFVPYEENALFNIALYDNRTNKFYDDRTILLKPFLEKNFGVSSLVELHSSTVCTTDDLKSMVNEIEWEMSGFM